MKKILQFLLTIIEIYLGNNSILKTIKKIDETYKEIYNEKNIFVRITESFLIIISEIAGFISILVSLNEKLDFFVNLFSFNKFLYFGYKIIVITIIFVLLHYLIGYILLISNKISGDIRKEASISGYFLFSYFITSVCLVCIILIDKSLISDFIITGFVAIFISYIINLKILFVMIRENKKFKDKLITSLLLVILIIMNLFIAVALINIFNPLAFNNTPNLFDLFYFTVTTFTTIGFGDIIPISIGAKLMVIIISFTSILCSTVFLSNNIKF